MEPPANILFIISDDHRQSALGVTGDPIVATPTLDRLAAGGCLVLQSHIMGGLTDAVCAPSRAALLTGTDPLRALGEEGGPREGDATYAIPPHLPVLPETFRRAGYRAFFTGKWHNDSDSFTRSFDEAEHIFFGGMSDHFRVPLHPFDPDSVYPEEAVYPGEGFSTELFTDAAIRFLRDYDNDRPFFAYVSFTAPHDPRTPPPPWDTMYQPSGIPLPPNFATEHPFDNGELRGRDERLAGFPRAPTEVRAHIADYYGMISNMDHHIGRLLESLDATGRRDDTIVIYIADHGLAVGQHGLMGKQNVYDHSIRIPLLLNGPGIPGGATTDALHYNFDLLPTLCELAGIKVPDTITGRSMVSALHGGDGRETLYAFYKDTQRMVKDRRWKYITYSVPGEPKRHQLFDLNADPWETTNLAEGQSDQIDVMRQIMQEWRNRVGH